MLESLAKKDLSSRAWLRKICQEQFCSVFQRRKQGHLGMVCKGSIVRGDECPKLERNWKVCVSPINGINVPLETVSSFLRCIRL